jgi:hypothetical protein
MGYELTARSEMRLAGSAGPASRVVRRGARATAFLASLAAFSAAVACSGASTSEVPPGMELGDPLVPLEEIRQRLEYSEYDLVSLDTDSFALYMPLDLSLTGGKLVVSDEGNDRLVVFDTTLAPLRTLGRPGAGPGELGDPLFVAAAGERCWVVDLKNSRLSSYRLDGDFIDSILVPGQIGGLDVDSAGNIYIGSRLDGHFMTKVDTRGVVWPFARQAFSDADSARTRAFRGVIDLVAVTGGAGHYFDSERGVLMKFSPQGDLLLTRSLPDRIMHDFTERRRAEMESFAKQGMRLLGSPAARSLKPTEDGRLLLMLSGKGPVGLVIEPGDYSSRPLLAAQGDERWKALRGAYSAVLHGETVYALHQAGLTVYRVGPGPPGPR